MQVLKIEKYAILLKEAKDDEIPGEICNRYKLELKGSTYKEVFTQTDSFNAILIKIPGILGMNNITVEFIWRAKELE